MTPPEGAAPAPVFTVQRHHASTLHFDLRLEVGGVLVSWAVPKGPSLDPAVKRLAVRVGDHDLDHATYEGRHEGGRGPGTKIVWDTGTLTNQTRRRGRPVELTDAVAAGHLKVELHGHRLGGAFALTRTRMGGQDSSWILVKVDDAGAVPGSDVAATELTSVLSGRTNEDLESEPGS
ncbi:DNA ligase D, 3'-phosphoesterase domain-containing protein [Nocardioides scoriae]|uniref:DNA ligase D, 3'-phosphoesterase domain-containing protein n=1 Tax=Nocardioides scoriae TaxID=642780 RepID=A0A1H1LWD7_9ACTN|nr:DNA polymerase ligase N-terminal domain-containing protein [Nocardioides scoriae]SDR78727.1 DNA ligase D, 3'-phosphoesterase domain-containing protein [Nocardioides scoriae]